MADSGKGRSFEERFGAIVRSKGIAAVPVSLWQYQGKLGLTAGEMWLLGVLLSYRWTADAPYPSLHRIAEQSGLSRPRIQYYARKLVAKDLLEVVPRFDSNGRNNTSEYRLEKLFCRIEELMVDESTAEIAAAPSSREGKIFSPRASRHDHEGKPAWPGGQNSDTLPLTPQPLPGKARSEVIHGGSRYMEVDTEEVEDPLHAPFLNLAGRLQARYHWPRPIRDLAVEFSARAAEWGISSEQFERLAWMADTLENHPRTTKEFWRAMNIARGSI